MALDQSALLDLSEALRTADSGTLMPTLLSTMLQALVDAEATAHIGAGPHQRTEAAPRSATAPVTGPSQRPPATSLSRPRRCRAGRSSRRCWRRAAGSGGGFEGDFVAEGFEVLDVVALGARR
jgi:putative transposase